jgi:LlaJI restriction endonuclease
MLTIREGERNNRSAWLEKLQIEEPTLSQLLDDGVLREDAHESFRLAFVGFIRTPTDLVLALPGAPEGERCNVDLIRACFQRYFRQGRTRKLRSEGVSTPEWTDKETFAELDATLTLAQSFAQLGPFLTAQQDRARRGKLDWHRTMRTPAFIGSNGPFYPDLHFRRPMHKASDVTRIQLALLDEYLRKYPIIDRPSGLDDAIRRYGSVSSIQLVAQSRRFQAVLDAERSLTYRTDMLLALDVMLTLLRKAGPLQGSTLLKIYGTVAFSYVWEDICRNTIGEDPILRETLAQPMWYLDSYPKIPGDEQRPDIIFEYEGKRVIVDAKYYTSIPASLPGWADIAKQLVYATSLPPGKQAVANAFLFPGKEPGFVRIGKVAVEHGAGSIGSVDAWKLGFFDSLLTYARWLRADQAFARIMLAG